MKARSMSCQAGTRASRAEEGTLRWRTTPNLQAPGAGIAMDDDVRVCMYRFAFVGVDDGANFSSSDDTDHRRTRSGRITALRIAPVIPGGSGRSAIWIRGTAGERSCVFVTTNFQAIAVVAVLKRTTALRCEAHALMSIDELVNASAPKSAGACRFGFCKPAGARFSEALACRRSWWRAPRLLSRRG